MARSRHWFYKTNGFFANGESGRIGQVGAIEVDMETGELIITEALIQEIKQNAHRLVTRTLKGSC